MSRSGAERVGELAQTLEIEVRREPVDTLTYRGLSSIARHQPVRELLNLGDIAEGNRLPKALAVTAMTGISAVAGSTARRRVASRPSRSFIFRSMNTTSGRCACASE